MGRPRKRFCPYGHDKDAPGGSAWSRAKTYKGVYIAKRVCAECKRRWDREHKRTRSAAKMSIYQSRYRAKKRAQMVSNVLHLDCANPDE